MAASASISASVEFMLRPPRVTSGWLNAAPAKEGIWQPTILRWLYSSFRLAFSCSSSLEERGEVPS